MKRRWFLGCLLLAILISANQPGQALAEEKHFTATFGSWSSDDDWDPYGVPQDGDDVYIDAGTYCDVDEMPAELSSLTIYGELDNTVWGYDFYVTSTITVKNNGVFNSDGDITVLDQMWFEPGASGVFNGSVEVGDYDSDDILSIADDVTFNGTVEVDGTLHFGNGDEYLDLVDPGSFSVTFNGKVTADDLEVGDTYGYANVTFKDTLDVGGDATITDRIDIRKYMDCVKLTIESSGEFHAYGDLRVNTLEMEYEGEFYSEGDYTYTITYKLGMDGTFQLTKGTVKMSPKSSFRAKIYTNENCYLHNLVISGDNVTEIANYSGSNYPLDVNGDLTIESGKTLDANSWTLKLAGHFVCNGTYSYDAGETPTVLFDGSGTQNLTGNVDFYNLTINSGSTVNTGNYTPSVAPASLTENGYLLGNIKCTQPISSDATYSLGNLGCQITNGSGLGTVTVTRHTGSAHSGASHSLTRWYNLSASTADNSVTLRLYYRDSELNGNTEANLNIWRYSGGAWTKYEATSRDASSDYVEATVSIPAGSSDWILSDAEDDQSLPVNLIRADVVFNSSSGAVRMVWVVGSEIENRGYEIYRREEGQPDYERIGFVEGQGTSPISHEYTFEDPGVERGVTYFYRLVSVSLSGEREILADELRVTASGLEEQPHEYALLPNYPNPFNPGTTIVFAAPERCHVQLRVYDLHGRLVATLRNGVYEAGRHRVYFDGSGLPSGVYVAAIQMGDFTATRKMVLMK